MSVVDIVIVAAVIAAVCLCVRRLMRQGAEGQCSGCSSAGSCKVARAGKGTCPACDKMVEAAERAAASSTGETS